MTIKSLFTQSKNGFVANRLGSFSRADSKPSNSVVGNAFKSIFDYAKSKQVKYMNGVLSNVAKKQSELKSQLEYHQGKVNEVSELRSQIVDKLMAEEREWRNSLEKAEKMRASVAYSYAVEYINFHSKLHQTRSETNHKLEQVEVNPVTYLNATIQPLEAQRSKLRVVEYQVKEATNQLKFLQEKPESIQSLVKNLQDARNRHWEAISQYHIIKDKLYKVDKAYSKASIVVTTLTSNSSPMQFKTIASYILLDFLPR